MNHPTPTHRGSDALDPRPHRGGGMAYSRPTLSFYGSIRTITGSMNVASTYDCKKCSFTAVMNASDASPNGQPSGCTIMTCT
jgi:hypothetical protein